MNNTRRQHDSQHRTRISLSIKLLAAFALVIIVTASVVAVMSQQSATREFSRFVREDQEDAIEPPDDLVTQLAAHYAQHGNWTGVEEVLGQINLSTTDNQRTFPVLLIDEQGSVVASNWIHLSSNQLPEYELTGGWPVQVGGQIVGTLIEPGRRPLTSDISSDRFSPQGTATVRRIQQAIVIAGLSAGAVALIIAGVLTWGLVRPLRQLTAAAGGIAQGDLSQRVPIAGNDEVSELAAAFNRMAAELERAEQLRCNMTADVAHELRTPLSIVRGKLEGVMDGVYPATPEHLQPILEAIDLLTYLVEDLRMLAQAEAGKLILEKQMVNIGDLLQDAQINFEPQASDQGVTLALNLPSDPPEVVADWHRLMQVLGNLLTNALYHTPEGGQVTLSATAVGGRAKVTVTDTGAGIRSEDLPQIFDRYWRGEKTRAQAGGGIGLGLSIARQLVELHGGTIGVESAPRQGSLFWFTLPVV